MHLRAVRAKVSQTSSHAPAANAFSKLHSLIMRRPWRPVHSTLHAMFVALAACRLQKSNNQNPTRPAVRARATFHYIHHDKMRIGRRVDYTCKQTRAQPLNKLENNWNCQFFPRRVVVKFPIWWKTKTHRQWCKTKKRAVRLSVSSWILNRALGVIFSIEFR